MWFHHETLILYLPEKYTQSEENTNINTTQCIAGFDLDSTLTQSKSGRKFVVDANDWIFTYESVPDVLVNLQNNGYTIVIFTNQLKYSMKVLERIDSIRMKLNEFGVDPIILISTRDDVYRKPNRGMLEILLELLYISSSNESYFYENSLYVGDAVGATSEWPPYTWADTDFEFAKNCRISFHTPMDIFPVKESKLDLVQELVLTVGNPGSGKTSYSTSFSEQNPNYVVISQDVYGNKDRVKKQMIKVLNEGKSAIIDRTNPNNTDREEFINLARSIINNIKVRIWWFARDGRPFNDLRSKRVPDIVYNIYSKNFQEPETNEEEDILVERIN